MAKRPVFMSNERRPYFTEWQVDFTYHSGFAVSQKQKNILAIHSEFVDSFPDKRVLEISSKSLQPEGVMLSAFNLKKHVPSLNASLPVECIFQSGKIFEHGGPYSDLLVRTAREAKRDERIRSSGDIIGFSFEGERFPAEPKTAFYDFIYISALLENEKLASELLKYDAFTDIEFTPAKSLNCQARTAAKFVSLVRTGKIDQARSFDSFLALFRA